MDYYSPRSSPELDLTPRSKIRALLAAFDDDDSGKENEPALPAKVRRSNSKHGSPTQRIRPVLDDQLKQPIETPLSREVASNAQQLDEQVGAYARIRQQFLEPREPVYTLAQDAPALSAEGSCSPSDHDTSNRKRKRAGNDANTTEALQSPLVPRGQSPALFVSPARSSAAAPTLSEEESSDDDLPDLSTANQRLRELVARKRAERIAREMAVRDVAIEDELEENHNQIAPNTKRAHVVVESESDGDQAAADKLTQQARPTRKASKKAIEEISRETQRLSRNMQLTHEARVRTKFSTADFFSKFKFRQTVNEDSRPAYTLSGDASSSSDPQSPPNEIDTPPTSPPSAAKKSQEYKATDQSRTAHVADTLGEKATGEFEKQIPRMVSEDRITLSARSSILAIQPKNTLMEDSDDELEVSPPRQASRVAIFDRLPPPAKRDPRSIQTLRALAHVESHSVKGKHKRQTLSAAEMQSDLRRRAREQALAEKAERIQALRDRGVIIQTAEEKERDQLELESLVEKARKEAEALLKKEKEDAKKNGGVEDNHLPDSDEEEDEDWADGVEAEGELSGSDDDQDMAANETENDDEEDEEADTEADDTAGISKTGFFETEASEADSEDDREAAASADEIATEDEQAIGAIQRTPRVSRTNRRKTIIVVDEEDEEDNEDVVRKDNADLPQMKPPVTPRPTVMNAFGFATNSSGPLGLTQMFAGSMSDSQSQDTQAFATAASPSIPLSFPSPLNPPLRRYDTGESDDIIIQSSQPARQDSAENPSIRLTATPLRDTQDSELPEPTQDVGFQSLAEDVPVASYSTVATMPLAAEEPYKRRGIRRGRVHGHAESPDVVAIDAEADHNAFAFMRKANAKAAAVADFDKKRSKAREMVEEQAEESEDEYAGLGGVSDDDSQGELDDDTRRMIDDDSNEVADEQQNAALFADRERAEDEKRVEKLFKDINGGWRRKRGAELDFSDDDDDGAARRRAKQREFARMRRALLADEKLGKIAENPKQEAFLKAIEDRDGDEDMDLLEEAQDSQTNENHEETNVSLPAKDAQALESQTSASKGVWRSQRTRRTNGFTKPSSLVQIRSVISEMIGESETVLASQDTSDSSDSEVSVNDELDILDEADGPAAAPEADPAANMAPPAFIPPGLRRHRTAPSATRGPVIDRKVLKRSASNVSLFDNDATNVKPAFFAPSLARSNSMRPPSLLRRATTNSTTSSEGTASLHRTVSVNSASGSEERGKETVRMSGGPKRSSVNWYAREKERMAKVESFEKERAQGRERVGQMRRNRMSTGLGIVGVGSFDN